MNVARRRSVPPSAARRRAQAAVCALALAASGAVARAAGTALPVRLSETGLYADFASRRIADGRIAFTPQYQLWSDGATKRRWVALPPGTWIDASDPDAWNFPVGTRLWKEFAFGRPVETRYMERGVDGWTYATYRWLADGSDAVLSPEFGERRVHESAPGVWYDLPSRYDCRACHEGNVSPVLGFGALQLSGDRDPNAIRARALEPGEVDLSELVARGLVRGLPEPVVATPPRIPARSADERAALGYLVANCSYCHNDRGALADLGLSFEVRVATAPSAPPGALATAIGHAARYQPAGEPARLRLAPGHPEESAVWKRMASRVAVTQMPPLATKLVDREAVELLERWIRNTPPAPDGEPKVSEKEMR